MAIAAAPWRDEPVESTAAPTRRLADRPRWHRRYALLVATVDVMAAMLATVVASTIRFGTTAPRFHLGGDVSIGLAAVAAVLVPGWLLTLATAGAYDQRLLGNGFDEYRRVIGAGVRLLAALAIVLYLTESEMSRAFVGLLIPTMTFAALLGRNLCRKVLHRQRLSGRAMSRVLALGTSQHVSAMAQHLQRSPWAGYTVVGACVADLPRSDLGDLPAYPAGTVEDVLSALDSTGAHVLAITDTSAVPAGTLRELSWRLEGSGVDLVVAPAVTDIAGPRISIRPVAGLPLLHVEEPRFDGAARLFKTVFDRASAAIGLVVLSPLLLAAAAVVRLSSGGPVLYRQVRVGRGGHAFKMLKFRTMRENADQELAELLDQNDAHGPLFKIHSDPRITPLGRVLRRLSLDELPQLINVLRGEMSIVGPRPPLPHEVEQYGDAMRRRFLVKPGVTGLWQVSGRSDLTWEESVRLDLHYVDHWSPALDFVILSKTLVAVVRGAGAY